MVTENFVIDYVQLESGNFPFKKFLESLEIRERAEILASLEELKFRLNNKMNLSQKLSRYLRDGIFELRVKHLNKISRSLYFFQIGKVIVMTNGFIKKTETTPKNEIEQAIQYKTIYLRSKND